MSEALKLGVLDIDAAAYGSQGSAVLGIRDSGKTYTATLLAERIFHAGIPFIAFDPVGVWRFLRVSGRGPGLPVVVAGGVDGDLALTPATAPAIVEAAVQNGVSLVIDLFSMELSKADWRRIVRDSVRLLLHRNAAHGLRHVFIEEAAEFAPQRVMDGEVYAEIEKLARMGGNARLGYTLINQRAEEVNKAVLELCDNLFLHRQKGRNSLIALGKWLNVGNVANHQAIIQTLSALPTGDCWAWLAGVDTPVRVTVPEKDSFHPDRRIMRGASALGAGAGAPADVSAFVASMRASLPSPPQAPEPRKRTAPALPPLEPPDLRTVRAEEYQRGHREGYEEGFRAARVAWSAEFRDRLDALAERLAAVDGHLRKTREALLGMQDGEDAPVGALRELLYTPTVPGAGRRQERAQPSAQQKRTAATPRPSPARSTAGPRPGAELRILKVLAQRHPARLTMAQWATLSGMSRRGGTWVAYLSRLRGAGYLDQVGPTIGVTPAGLAAADVQPQQPETPAEIRRMWKNALGGGPARVIDVLVRNPSGLRRDALAAELRMSPRGGAFGGYLSPLRSNGLISEVRGQLHLVQELLE